MVQANQRLPLLCVQQRTAKSVMAVEIPVAHSVASNATHVASAQSALKVKLSAVTAVVATHAVAVVVSVLENAVLSAPLSAVTKFVAKPVQKVGPRGAPKAETMVAAHVQTVVISAMNLALMQKATKLLQIV